MRVMIIQPWVRQGGAELISVHLAYELERQGHEAQIACSLTWGVRPIKRSKFHI
jgi:hypothetical protein